MQKSEMKKKKKQRKSIVLTIGCIMFACYFVAVIIGQQTQIKAAKDEKNALQAELNEQILENEEISRMLENGDEAEYIERIAREQLGYVMPDERVFYDISGSSR